MIQHKAFQDAQCERGGTPVARRAALHTGAILAGSLIAGSAALAAEDVVVETNAGKLRGRVERGIFAFKGIPYGADTSGEARFMPPRPPIRWLGVRDAFVYGPRSPQAVPGVPEVGTRAPVATATESEDCLVLNVWTPSFNDGARRPVMFWCHGGGFAQGSGARAVTGPTDGINLCRRGDVVVVTVNHRLNLFGFLDLADLGGDAYAASGNVGMLDLVAALVWVRENIAVFGGDAQNVTIFGVSGGGMKVSTLMAMPAAQGLFHRAIIQSGPGLRVRTRADSKAVTAQVLKALEITPRNLAKLGELSWRALQKAAGSADLSRSERELLRRMPWSPVVDGHVIPRQPFDPDSPVAAANIPVIIGTTAYETLTLLASVGNPETWDETALREALKAKFGDTDGKIYRAYRTTYARESAWDLFHRIASDIVFRVDSIRLAERKAAQNAAPVYMYLFAWETPAAGGRLRSHHVLDVPFVFDNVASSSEATGLGPAQEALAENMSEAWIAFARTGDPNHAGLPFWSPYTSASRATMIFNAPCVNARDPGRVARLLPEAF